MDKIVSEQQFEEKINQENTTIIKFFTNWCPDCKRLDTFIDDIIVENTNKQWYEVNAEDLQNIAEKYDVRGIPSLLVFKNGEKIAHLHSAKAKTPGQIREFLSTI